MISSARSASRRRVEQVRTESRTAAAGLWDLTALVLIHRGYHVAARVCAGTVGIDDHRVVGPGMPFGGFDDSGLGRENDIGPPGGLAFCCVAQGCTLLGRAGRRGGAVAGGSVGATRGAAR
ncbi:aldehyde dehydrogenase family protein [Promicromonospora thailandica]|uniref:aldehyde dehydrogenase family protein n=1 Tax=Promicromonospora thailandica TaxID=765201 RepID=UPI0020A291FB|nr:hypothetical protein [Promicromonospora thailandica]BFF16630.1 hypothetical protein GCM10025730_01510 [Promicromonospora thailandica]